MQLSRWDNPADYARRLRSPAALADAKMLFNCAVSFAVSCVRQGRLFTARVRLILARASQLARAVCFMSSLLRRGRTPGLLKYHFLKELLQVGSSPE